MDENLSAVKGRIFDVQRFSIHDGPGIRTIIFLKGCGLRCRWCCNPESQSFEIEQMKTDDGKVKTVGKDVTAGEMISLVTRDRAYYRRSGGGMTLSGGEFLLQPEFSEALLRLAKENGINTAVETTSCAQWSVIEKVLPYIDNYLMDIKHMDSDKHRAFTTRPNELMLDNAKRIAERVNRMVIRVPVIPTFNDTEEEISRIAAFASTLPNVKELHLLPYHRFGIDKYRWLGREYTLNDISTLSDEKIKSLLNAAQKSGLQCQIGG